MAGKKGQLHQVLFTMVDATDFATIESGVVAASCAARFYGVNHGGSAAMTSGAISKALSLVRSGILRATLKTTENAYDYMLLKVTESDTGCAPQLLTWENEGADNSDIYSMLSDLVSNFDSRVTAIVPTSAAVSDLYSMLSDLVSNFDSRVTEEVANASMLAEAQASLSNLESRVVKEVANASALADVHSALSDQISVAANDLASAIADLDGDVANAYSMLSDLVSNFDSRVTGVMATSAAISDIESQLDLIPTTNYTSSLSDIHSLITAVNSDLASKIGGITATLSDSDISNIASAVQEILVSDFSDVISAIGAVTVTLTASNVSDIGSAVAAAVGVTVDNIYSMLSDLVSNFDSRVTGVVATSAAISDIESQLDLVPITNNSAAISDIYSLLSDLNSNILSRVPKEVASKSLLSDVNSDLASKIAALPVDSDINAQVLDVLNVDTFAELAAGAPSGTPTIVEMLQWPYEYLRNKRTQTSSTGKVYKDDASTELTKYTIADDGTTFTKGELEAP